MENLLLTFTGFQDPYTLGLIGEEEQSGPILSLAGVRIFDRIILFSTPRTEGNTSSTREALNSLYPDMVVEVRSLPLEDPTNYIAILKGLRAHIREITESTHNANFFISVASGTPQMHACWVLLASSGEIPARILNVRPQRFVTKERPLVSEIDLTSPEFPVVRSGTSNIKTPDSGVPDFETVVKQLGIAGDHPTMRRSLEIGAALAPYPRRNRHWKRTFRQVYSSTQQSPRGQFCTFELCSYSQRPC